MSLQPPDNVCHGSLACGHDLGNLRKYFSDAVARPHRDADHLLLLDSSAVS